jgi:outer membrane protein OmpA-like peptidoglycan-associated protein/tetratricopeptide (TPR) repeat protein
MKKIITLFILISVSAQLFAQSKNIEFTKDNFPDRKKELKEALDNIETANKLFAEWGEDFPLAHRLALPSYLKAYEFNPNNALLNYKVGKAILLTSLEKSKALPYFLKAQELNPAVAKDLFYLIGQAYQIRAEWDKAINEYKRYQKTLSPSDAQTLYVQVDKKIKECETGKVLVANPVRVFIDNLGPTVNSKYADYGPVINADETILMFTSLRDQSTGGKLEPTSHEYYEDIYESIMINGEWSKPLNMGKPINTEGHDAVVGLSPDGTKLLIYLDDKGDGNIYECDLKGEVWSKPRKLDKTINSPHHESSASFSPDGRSLYFVSNRPGGFGEHDIYKSDWDEVKERWKEPVNLGPGINTPYDEKTVFMHPDGKTMYFSSNGHNNMGGQDIFKSELKNGIWQKPINEGYPINTPDDDVFFVLSASGKHGYYTSFSPDGVGEKDIFRITFLGPEKLVVLSNEDNLLASVAEPIKSIVIEPEVVVARNRVTILKGIVQNAVSLEPIEARIELFDNELSESVANFSSNSTTGKYLVSLPAGKNYGLAVKADGYLFHSENFIIPESAAYQEITKNIKLKKIEVGSTIVLKNIFFDFDKATLRPESTVELENLRKILVDNGTIKVEISGHTDSKGSDEYNLKLSDDRAKAVVDYLISKGIKKERLVYKGYGESVPIASNDNEEGRQLNRRTEFKILGL